MSVVIIGGHERMESQYHKICKQHNCKSKVFTKKSGRMADQIGTPDIMILFTNTVSHRMVHSAVGEAERKNIEIIRYHSSSCSALNEILANACQNA